LFQIVTITLVICWPKAEWFIGLNQAALDLLNNNNNNDNNNNTASGLTDLL